MTSLAGRRAIVTGANGTFGQHLCRALTAAGAHVVGLDLIEGHIVATSPDGTGEVPAATARSGLSAQRGHVSVPVLACDLTDDNVVSEMVAAAVARLGGLDLLINNAGVGGPAPAELPPGAAAYRQVEVNLFAAWRTTAAALSSLEASRGRVIFVASRMAVLPLPLAAAYGVSKRAVAAYADALRLEVGSHIGVSVVYPSMVASPIHDATVEAGLSLQGVSRYEPVSGVVDAILRAATARRAPRYVATTRRGRFEMAIARHLPRVAAAMVRRTIASRLAAGDLDSAPLAAGLRRRAGRNSP